jgi:hypothetical protein
MKTVIFALLIALGIGVVFFSNAAFSGKQENAIDERTSERVP